MWAGADGATPKPKRSLEDMMGSGAATSIGFGAPVSIPAGFGAGSSGAAATALQLPGRLFVPGLYHHLLVAAARQLVGEVV